MGNIVFSCPICKADLQVDDRLKGGLARCYQCDSTVMVPMTGVYEGMELGRYVIDSLIGEGGMGQVWLAKQQLTELEVAIKVLSPALTASPDSVAKFMREIELSSKLKHQSLVTVKDAGAENGVYYYVTDYVDGENLKEKLDRECVIYEKEALQIAYHVADALKHAWSSHKIIHSDVSPSNIMLDESGEIKILDLGIARTAEKDKTLTQTGMIVGSPHYMSPEQAMEDSEIDFRADIYALGATLYHLVTGRVPFDGKNAISIITKHVNDSLPLPNTLNPNLSDGCSALINQMMSKKKELRPASWDEVLNSIDTVLAGKMPQVKLSQTDSTKFDNTSFQKINLAALRNINQEAPKAEQSSQPRPEKEKMAKRKKQLADKRAAAKKGVKKTQMSISKTKTSMRPVKPSDSNISKRVRMAKIKSKKKDNTWLIIGIAGGLFVFFMIGLVAYNINKNKEKEAAKKRELALKKKKKQEAAKKVQQTTKSQSAKPAKKTSTRRTPSPSSTQTDEKKLKQWKAQNSERGKRERTLVNAEMAKIDKFIEKAIELDGKEVVCSTFAEEGTIKPENVQYEFVEGTKLRFSPGDYVHRFELSIQANTIIEGAPGVQLQQLRLFGNDGRTIVRNLNCEKVEISGDCLFYNCKFQSVEIEEGTAIFSKCLITSFRPTEGHSKAYFTKCKFAAENYDLPKGLIYCDGSSVIKVVNSAFVPGNNPAIVASKDFSGKLYLDNCYIPSKSFGAIVTSHGRKEVTPTWAHMVKHPRVTIISCHEN